MSYSNYYLKAQSLVAWPLKEELHGYPEWMDRSEKWNWIHMQHSEACGRCLILSASGIMEACHFGIMQI